MVSGWTIFFGLVGAYMLFLVWLVRSGRMEKWNLSLLLGFILMIRTQHGRGALAFAAKPKRLWNAFGDLGVVVTFVGMALMTFLMLALVPTVLNPRNNIQPLAASEILVIPGVNPFVPLWYGIIALIVTLVVHEGGHGVLALTNKMRVKSVGLLFAIVPVGAFVEPDEDDLMESPRRSRLRVYAAGASINIATAAVLIAVFAMMIGSVAPIAGAQLASVTADSPALEAGLVPGDIIVAANNTTIDAWAGLTAVLGNTTPDQSILIRTHDGGVHNATLVSRWETLENDEAETILNEEPAGVAYCARVLGPDDERTGGECAERLQELGFLGVAPPPLDIQAVLAEPLGNDGRNLLLYLSLPLGEVRGVPYLSTYLPTFHETPWAEEIFWPVANIVFWVFWINLMVGLTNILPMLPLDGGHLFRDGVAGLFDRFRPKMEPERRDRIVGRMAATASLVILGAFLLQIFGPRIAQAFA